MKRWILGLAVLASCGPAKPAATVPAPPVAATPTTNAPAADDGLAPPQPTLRLPRNFLPTQYALRLELDPAATGFEGAVQIAGNVSEKSRVIWLHGRKLTVRKAVAQRDGQPDVALTARAVGEDFLELRAAQPLDAGAWTLAIDYAASYEMMNTAGVFKQSVGEASYVFSQFEAIYARRGFPCFDEPDSKVPWKITLDVPQALVAVSNAPEVASQPLGNGKKRVEFAVTKPLPSYLVAFGVGPFDIVDAGKTKRGTPVRIIALAKRGQDAAYAAKTSTKLIELLEDYFGMPFPYDKMDMLTVPITVGFGAMENAGLITYSETLVLFDNKASKERQLRWISVAAHELAHQWFGDLVTMKYWDDIWLNEGFASWMQKKITQRFEPAWHEEQSVLSTRTVALEGDSLVTARQIRQPIATQDDIYTAFDRITYDKGASILGMFETYLGEEAFQRGIRDYMAAHAWGNAASTDLAAAISKASGKDIGPAFSTFLDQAGTPEIAATLQCEGGAPRVALTQQRYLPPGAPAASATKPWILPVCVAYERNGKRAEACSLLDAASGAVALETKACPRWMMPNVNGRGYYRSAYTAAQVSSLRDEAWPQLTWTERRALFGDVRDSVGNGKLPLPLALSFVPKMLAGGDRFTVGPAVQLALSLRRFVPDELRGKYEAWLRQSFGPAARKLGLLPRATDTIDDDGVRDDVTRAVVWIGHDPQLTRDAVKLGDKWRDLPAAVRGDILQIAVDGSPALFERVRAEVVAEQDRTKRQEMIRALASVRDAKRQEVALTMILEGKLDVRESLPMLVGGLRGGGRGDIVVLEPSNVEVSQAFFRAHRDELMKLMPKDGTAGGYAKLGSLFTDVCRADRRDEVAAYVRETFGSLPGGARATAQSLEQMDQCIARRAIVEPEIRGWLTGAKPAKEPTSKKSR